MEQNDALMRQEDELDNEQIVETPPENQNNDEDTVEESSNEVVEEQESSSVSMEDLLEEEGLELDFPKQGEVRTGIIATIGEGEVLVSVGTKSEGVISGRELELIPEEEKAEFKVGYEIPVYVVTPEDSNGNVVLSYSRAREEKDWEDVGRMHENDEVVDSKVIGFNKGGLIVPIGRLRGFVPASQVSLVRRMSTTGDTPEERWGNMIDDPIQVRIIEVDRERRRLILSERKALQETRESLKDRLLEDLHEGDVRRGRVTSLAEFGAFVNIEGADGLVHLSEISWERIKHPSEVLEIGQEVDVKVISIDRERKRIGLSMRQLQEDPWMKKVDHLKEGMLVEGTITHITKFGAFARIDENLEGLVHVSELSEQRIEHPKEVVHEGDVVTLRVIKIDPERHRIGLSLRKVDSPAYADLDWKMALAQEVGKAQEPEGEDEVRSIIIESEEEVEETQAEVVEETVEAAEEEQEVEETTLEAAEEEQEVEETTLEAEELVEEAVEEAVEAAEEEQEIEETILEAAEEEQEVEETTLEAEELVEEAEETVEEAPEAAEEGDEKDDGSSDDEGSEPESEDEVED